MHYAEALALAKRPVQNQASAAHVKVLANARHDAFCTYLAAFGRSVGREVTVEPPTFASLFAEGERGGDWAVAFVTVDDVFPELSFRSASPWSKATVEAILAERGQRINQFCATLASVLRRWRRVVIVPPFLDPPALAPVGPGALSQTGVLADGIRFTLVDLVSPLHDVEILDAAAALREIAPDVRADMRMGLRTANFVSPDAARELARVAQRMLWREAEPCKCVITDLDETLWAGVIGDGGAPTVSAADQPNTFHHHIYAKFLKSLQSEGAVLALVSDNNPQDVIRFLGDRSWAEGVGLSVALDDFAATRFGWEAKSQKIAELLQELRLLPSSCVFIDNDPYQLFEVSRAIPELVTLRFPEMVGFDRFIQAIRERFPRPGSTSEDSFRTRSYTALRAAETARESHGSVQDFLRDLGLRATFSVAGADEARPLDLVNKTNQFTLTGARYSAADWAALLGPRAMTCIVGTLADRFGYHGTVLTALLCHTGGTVAIHELTVSCRVFNRGLETAFLGWLVDRSAAGLTARFKDTGRNQPARTFLLTHGFIAPEASAADATVWTRSASPPPPHFVATTGARPW